MGTAHMAEKNEWSEAGLAVAKEIPEQYKPAAT